MPVRPGMSVRPAREEELPTVAGILDDVTLWQRRNALPDPWPIPFPVGSLRPRTDEGAIYLVDVGRDVAVATFTLLWEDPSFWGMRPPDAGYLHKIAVRRSHAREGIGAGLIDWASARVWERGRRYLRLDTLAENARLHAYYRALGFTVVGRVRVNGLECHLFEKSVG